MFEKQLLIVTAIVLSLLGCGSCGPAKSPDPNIREMPGKEFCPDFCNLMTEKGKNDPICQEYAKDTEVTLEDGGQTIMTCVEWCIFEQENSIQLNPKCMSLVSRCDQVDCASRLSPTDCPDTMSVDILCP